MNLLTPEKLDGHTHGGGVGTLPVVEIFGPTVQGEGPEAGRPAYFVRFGGCDFRCSWCDSMHAVDPAVVRATSEQLAPQDIRTRLRDLHDGPGLVVLSGGNPALLELGALIELLREAGFRLAVETQGSRWKPWLARVDCLVVSPKGPSSGMDNAQHRRQLTSFLQFAHDQGAVPVLKAVIFNDEDLEYARWLSLTWPDLPLHLSTGTDVDLAEEETIGRLLTRLRWLSETVAHDRVLSRAQVGVQQHVLAWGTRKGV